MVSEIVLLRSRRVPPGKSLLSCLSAACNELHKDSPLVIASGISEGLILLLHLVVCLQSKPLHGLHSALESVWKEALTSLI